MEPSDYPWKICFKKINLIKHLHTDTLKQLGKSFGFYYCWDYKNYTNGDKETYINSNKNKILKKKEGRYIIVKYKYWILI